MNAIKTDIEGLAVLEPVVHGDARGYFLESWNERDFDAAMRKIWGEKYSPVRWVQDNESLSRRGVLRGLHFQKPPFAQAKLVRVVRGRVLDVAVDLRKGSPTYGRHFACELSEENHRQCFLPRGVAHGFCVLSDEALFQYKCDEFYHPEAEGGINILDPSLGIDWGLPLGEALLSDKDLRNPMLSDFDSPFEY